LFNGAIRTDENLEMARLLRRKTATLIAFGACAATGGIPALSNLHSRAAHFASIYGGGPSLDNAAGRFPSVHTAMPEGDLELPGFHERVKRLEEVVAVDYTIPGCPPEPHQIWNVVKAVIEGAALPPRGSVLGAGQSTVCEECVRPKQEKRIAAFRRNFEVVPDATTCLLEQGLLCMGPATRDGCRAPCPRANMPCTGCYGPPEGVRDQGAKMIAALGSVVDFENCRGSDEEQLAARIESVCDSLPDAAGTFYRYGLAAPILDRR
jgi:F420-non-reducing hydrogenase small subunit